MKPAGWIALLATLLAVPPPAWAQSGDGRPRAVRPGHFFAERQALREQRGDLRGDLREDAGRDEAAPGRCDGHCRLSPEERRQLRRDIHEAGRDLYRRGQLQRD